MRRLAGTTPPLLVALAAAAMLAACGSSGGGDSQTARAASAGGTGRAIEPPLGHNCQELIALGLGMVAQRIYDAARHGNVVGQAVNRVKTSTALARAVSADDAPAARAALRSLMAGQIVGVQVMKAGKVFATVGSGVAIAPVSGGVAGTNATFTLSTQRADSYLKVAHQVTGADVVLLDGSSPEGRAHPIASTLPVGTLPVRLPLFGRVQLTGHAAHAFSLGVSQFPAGALRIVLLVPPTHGPSCEGSREQAASETLGHVGERIYHEEADSPTVRATLHHIEADHGFQQAVAARDSTAIRAAIVRFFGEHIHVVRVRVYAVEPSGAQRFLYDLGGPYVLAPVHGVVRSAGRIVGKFSYAIQDDAGYLRLAHLFTGAEILMRTGGKQVTGTLDPGPFRIPHRGLVTYRGKHYAAYSFTGEAFPSGPLQISLLTPIGEGPDD
ncbi:MAG TPA: hypothetical protein VHW67_07420 [Solirubrobacteraceae bacterium]|jgi:hypothetical protein|nr:hypothetical protein [Solirubrobacteraceae bacterium]